MYINYGEDMTDEETPLLKTKLLKVPLDKLKLDINNVRFQHLSKALSDKEMEDRIWAERDTHDLFEQIREAQGLYEAPIINSDFVVIEGNRRIVCLRHLKEQAKTQLQGTSKDFYSEVPCKQIDKNESNLNTELYLASIHISGKKPWPLFNRAKRVNEIRKTYNYSYDKLAKKLGMSKATLIRTVDAYEQTDKYRRRFPNDKDWYHKFSYFDELYKRRALKKFANIQENVDRFATWLNEGKFKDHRDVRALERILTDSDALQAFEKRNFNEALKLLEEKDPTLKSPEFKQITKTIRLISAFPRKELLKTINNPQRIKILENLKTELDEFIKDIKSAESKQKGLK